MNDLIRNAQHSAYDRGPRAEPSYEFHDVSVPVDIQELRDAIVVTRNEVYALAKRLDEVERWQRDIYGEF